MIDTTLEGHQKFGYRPKGDLEAKKAYQAPEAWGELSRDAREQLLRSLKWLPGSRWVQELLDSPVKITKCAGTKFRDLSPVLRQKLIEELAEDGHFIVRHPVVVTRARDSD